MIAAIDFGSSLTKAIVFDGKDFHLFKFSLSYSPQKFSRRNVLESIKILQKLSGNELINSSGHPVCEIYVSTELPLFGELSEKNSPYQTLPSSKILSSWEIPILDCGYQFVRFMDYVAVQSLDESQVIKWLPFKATLTEIENYINNRKIYSNVLPIFPRDLYIEQAMARESITQFLKSQGIKYDFGSVVMSGSIFSTSPFPSQSLLVLLDSLNFSNKMDVYLDRHSAVVALGLLKQVAPDIYSKAPDHLRPVFIGSVLRFSADVQVSIDLGLEKPLEVKVNSGDLFMFPLKTTEKATVAVRLGGGKPQEFEVCGGELGFVIDCRGFPPALPSDARLRIQLLKDWEKAIGATGRIHEV
jgi:hypothetical protein